MPFGIIKQLRHDLKTLFTGKIIRYLDQVSSTNEWADAEIKKTKVLEGTAFRAGSQTQGKGQRGRVWDSAPKKNLLVSYVLFPNFLPADKQFGLIRMVSLAIKDVLDRYLIDKATIKWPNDIYVNDLKIAGVLIESGMKGSFLGSSIIGIGLNVNQRVFENAPNATSLMMEIGRGVDLDQLFSELSFHLEHRYLMLRKDTEILNSEYLESIYRLNEKCTYRIDEQENEMTQRGVNPIGQILLEDAYGRINPYGLHEARMII